MMMRQGVAGLARAVLAGALVLAAGSAAWATGQPAPWQLGLQAAASTVAEGIASFHTLLLWIITLISLFVLALLVYVVMKFNERANPTPSRTTHNTTVEVVWTVVPVLILVVIAIPSFRLLKLQEQMPPADVTIKVTGKQWYWTVDYAKEHGGFTFDQFMLDDAQIRAEVAKGRPASEVPRLLAVDNDIVVPVNKVVRVQVTAADVLHSYAMPALGIKRDAVPGRLNETWFKATREGLYFGQCSELCGTNHAFMPSAIRVVSEEAFKAWLEKAKSAFPPSASAPGGMRIASH